MHESGIGFCGLLTIAFIVLKLCNVIDWAWVWVLSPLWLPLAVGIVVIAFMSFVSTLATVVGKMFFK